MTESRERLPVCFLCWLSQWGVKQCWEKSRDSIAWPVREIFLFGSSCPLANPRSLSFWAHHGKIQKSFRKAAWELFPLIGTKNNRTVCNRSLNNAQQYSLSSSLPVCLCASPSPLTPSAPRLPTAHSASPFALGLLLLLPASSCSFTDACPFLCGGRERELVSTANTGR